MADRVVGVDKARGGWVAVDLVDGAYGRSRFIERLGPGAFDRCRCVAIDIPLAYPRTGRRSAELDARKRLGRRASTVFLTPPAEAVSGSWEEARSRGVSKQSWNLVPFIEEARAARGVNWIEAHPELVFLVLAGAAPPPKKTWNGHTERRRLLADAGIEIPDDIGDAGRVAADDVLDAAACALLALRHPGGTVGLGAAEEDPIWTLERPTATRRRP